MGRSQGSCRAPARWALGRRGRGRRRRRCSPCSGCPLRAAPRAAVDEARARPAPAARWPRRSAAAWLSPCLLLLGGSLPLASGSATCNGQVCNKEERCAGTDPDSCVVGCWLSRTGDTGCSGNADSVEWDSQFGSCVCQCRNQWADSPGGRTHCDVCPAQFDASADCGACTSGHVGYPSCRQCDNAQDCSGRASSVSADAGRSNCVCECSAFYSGSQCETCPAQYDAGAGCARCAQGYKGAPPACEQCTVAQHCSGHAASVTDDGSRGSCVCSCANKWDGAACSNCPTQFDSAQDCAQCSGKRIGYPTCATECSNAQHCNGRAADVQPDAAFSRCVCTCQAAFGGTTCERCGSGHFGTYPSCTACTSAGSCSGHALTAEPDAAKTKCVCTCEAAYEGADCSRCAEGYINYPACTQCTASTHCGGAASKVTSDAARTSCLCTCQDKWTGPTCTDCDAKYDRANGCNRCAAGYINYDTCEQCTSAAHCSGNAKSVDSNSRRNKCVCTCNDRFAGADCGACQPKYEGYPACSSCAAGRIDFAAGCPQCTSAAHCSGHAASVTDDGARASCVCTCRNQWTGADCSACDTAMFDAAQDCGECASGRVEYPTCRQCQIAADCSGRASAVDSDAGRDNCVCTCNTGFGGSQCEKCASGYFGTYPACAECTSAGSCNGHADSAAPDPTQTQCVCRCSAGWEGTACDACAAGYVEAGGGSPPASCAQCTSAAHCSGHAQAVTSDAPRQTCLCTCRNQWSGAACDGCAAEFDTAKDCGQCTGKRIGYPSCAKVCDVAADCSGRATDVEANAAHTKCSCSCEAEYGGASCERCASGYFGAYPTCTPCTSAGSCNGHADSAAPSSDRSKCECRCSKAYEGTTCDACSAGHINYPTCSQCTSDAHCSGHARTVGDDGTRARCVCTQCRNSWEGAQCETCPAEFDSAADCGQCAQGRVGYPGCRECTLAADCGGAARARSVDSDGRHAGCVCACNPQYEGNDCGACATGYIQFPACTKCETAANCNGHAQGVSSDAAKQACVCSCSAGFGGAACERCVDGYVGYPSCRACSSATDCSGHAAAVDSASPWDECVCSCAHQWTGPQCATCPAKYGGAGCNECAMATSIYPTCEACSVAGHCSGHADSVAPSADRRSCVCTCRSGTQWGGADCDSCPALYDRAQDCANCAGNRVEYPTCRTCSIAADCSGNAGSVYASADKKRCVCGGKTGGCGNPNGCKCTNPNGCHGPGNPVPAPCNDQWTGDTCGTCPPQFEVNPATRSCDMCAEGHINYFICRQCTVADDCNGARQARSATSDAARANCLCACQDAFEGPKCEGCARGYIQYPACTECTSAAHCSGHASSVDSNAARDGCVCTCRNLWSGADCSQCPALVDADAGGGGDCDRCEVGAVEFPSCRRCTSAADCSGNAASVTSDRTACACSCKPEFAGTYCSVCADGHVGYPGCTECTSATHCNGNARAVETDQAKTQCVCRCGFGYEGAQCGGCIEGFRQSGTLCTRCTTSYDCKGHATSVSSSPDRSTCICSCFGMWSGADCNTCPATYGGSDCNLCAGGHIGSVPACTACDVATHCGGHATAVDDDGSRQECVCTCRNQWSGPSCSTCPDLYDAAQDCAACAAAHSSNGAYPRCGQRCTLGDCNYHAESVEWDRPTDTCVCNCRAGWTGATCQVCPAHYGGADCDRCAGRYIGYPNCTRCTSEAHCSGHACEQDGCVTTDPGQTQCACRCAAQWTGARCDSCAGKYDAGSCAACASGYVHYPLCEACTNQGHCRGRAATVESDSTRSHCTCNCKWNWAGADCGLCPEGKKCGEPGTPTVTATLTQTLTVTPTPTSQRCLARSEGGCVLNGCHWNPTGDPETGGGRCATTCHEHAPSDRAECGGSSRGECSWEGGAPPPFGDGRCVAICAAMNTEVKCAAEACEWDAAEAEAGRPACSERTPERPPRDDTESETLTRTLTLTQSLTLGNDSADARGAADMEDAEDSGSALWLLPIILGVGACAGLLVAAAMRRRRKAKEGGREEFVDARLDCDVSAVGGEFTQFSGAAVGAEMENLGETQGTKDPELERSASCVTHSTAPPAAAPVSLTPAPPALGSSPALLRGVSPTASGAGLLAKRAVSGPPGAGLLHSPAPVGLGSSPSAPASLTAKGSARVPDSTLL